MLELTNILWREKYRRGKEVGLQALRTPRHQAVVRKGSLSKKNWTQLWKDLKQMYWEGMGKSVYWKTTLAEKFRELYHQIVAGVLPESLETLVIENLVIGIVEPVCLICWTFHIVRRQNIDEQSEKQGELLVILTIHYSSFLFHWFLRWIWETSKVYRCV